MCVWILETFAPALAGDCEERSPPLTFGFLCVRAWTSGWVGTTAHCVVRGLRTDADLVNGNHWVFRVAIAEVSDGSFWEPHYPCQSRRCGRPGGSSTPLLMEVLQTAEQGDCGIDVMAFWGGKVRAAATWKSI